MRHDPDAFKRVFLAYVAEYGGKCTKPSQISRMYADAWVHALTKTMAVEKPVVINLKAAKILGIAAPPALLARADDVIE